MTDVQASGTTCSGSDWSCLTVNTNAAVFSPTDNEALIQVSRSSVNPIDMDGVEPVCVGFGCSVWNIGQEVAGTTVVVGDSCRSCRHQVWDVSKGAYAEYAVASCSQMSLIPLLLSFMPSGAVPTIGLSALQMFRNVGSFLVSSSSVAIVSGQGGLGSHVLPRFAGGITRDDSSCGASPFMVSAECGVYAPAFVW